MDEKDFIPPEPVWLKDGAIEYLEGDYPVKKIEAQDLEPVEVDEDDYSPFDDEGDENLG